jgi:hypothetical protein
MALRNVLEQKNIVAYYGDPYTRKAWDEVRLDYGRFASWCKQQLPKLT